MINKIREQLSLINNIEANIREYICTYRYQIMLMEDREKWNQICSSLDILGDTLLSISDYIETKYPKEIGLRYIYTYGILQVLYVQQDTVKHLLEAFSIKYKNNDKLQKIRTLRNNTVGHPSKRDIKENSKKFVRCDVIVRMTLSKRSFSYNQFFPEGKVQGQDVDFFDTLHVQLNEILNYYQSIMIKLKDTEKDHKDKYKDILLNNIFSRTEYLLEKVYTGIISSQGNDRKRGLLMLNDIQNQYKKFENSLQERNELDEALKHDLGIYNYALSRIKSFLANSMDDLNDAVICFYYIKNNHDEYKNIALKIDKEYNE